MIVRDNNGSTSVPSIADLFEDNNAMFTNQPRLTDPQTNSRFTVLWDKFIVLSNTGGKESVPFSYSMSLDHHVFFTGGAATDEGKGHLYLFNISNEATNDPIVSGVSVVKFIDN